MSWQSALQCQIRLSWTLAHVNFVWFDVCVCVLCDSLNQVPTNEHEPTHIQRHERKKGTLTGL